jgi:hypothetical protein
VSRGAGEGGSWQMDERQIEASVAILISSSLFFQPLLLTHSPLSRSPCCFLPTAWFSTA